MGLSPELPMSKIISFSTSHEDLVKLCAKYHCTTDELGRVMKASVLDLKHSPYYRSMDGELSAERLIEKLKRSESFSTSEETKEVLYTIFGGYVDTLKEFLIENKAVRERVI
jgi:hypothetical protein